MDKLDIILEKLGEMQVDIITIKTDINEMKADIKALKNNDEMLVDTTATILENQTDHEIRIQELESAI